MIVSSWRAAVIHCNMMVKRPKFIQIIGSARPEVTPRASPNPSMKTRLVMATTTAVLVAILTSRVTVAASTVDSDNKAGQPESRPKINNVLAGKNPKGDVVRWEDGSAWKNVTVKSFTMEDEGGRKVPKLEIGDVPPGFEVGKFAGFCSVSLRADAMSPPAIQSPSSATRMRDLRSSGRFPPLGEIFYDMFLCPYLDEYEARSAQPEYSLKAIGKDGKKKYGQGRITVSHLVVRDGQVYCLVRNSGGHAGVHDGWFSDIEMVIFGRETEKSVGGKK